MNAFERTLKCVIISQVTESKIVLCLDLTAAYASVESNIYFEFMMSTV